MPGLYVEETHFVLRTDHQALRWILYFTESSLRHARCQLRLMEFDVKIVHNAGAFCKALDALSRLSTIVVDEKDIDDDVSAYCNRNNQELRFADINKPQTDWDKILEALAIVGDATEDTDVSVMPDAEERLREQRNNTCCGDKAKRVGGAETPFEVDDRGLLCALRLTRYLYVWYVSSDDGLFCTTPNTRGMLGILRRGKCMKPWGDSIFGCIKRRTYTFLWRGGRNVRETVRHHTETGEANGTSYNTALRWS